METSGRMNSYAMGNPEVECVGCFPMINERIIYIYISMLVRKVCFFILEDSANDNTEIRLK